MTVTLIQVPYHLGREDVGLARGVPVLADALAEWATNTVAIERPVRFLNEVNASMAVVRALAETVRVTVEGQRSFPLVLAGNCNSSLGTVTGLHGEIGVVWFDAHADFNTPDTTRSGFFDGFALSMLTGTGWAALREGLRAIPEENIVLVGARDLDPEEEERLRGSRIARVQPGQSLDAALDALSVRVRSVYVHVDLDVLDPAEGRANWYAADGGLTAGELAAAIADIGVRFSIAAAALTAYAPECDPVGAVPQAAQTIANAICAAVRAGATA